MTGRNPRLGITLVCLGAGLFVVNAGVSRVLLRAGVAAGTLTTMRVTGSLLCLVLVAAVFFRPALRPPPGRLALLVVAHGLVGVAGLQWTYFVAIDRLPVGLALLLEYQAPILVALWARFVQHERVRRSLWLGLALATAGLAAATGLVGTGTAWDVDGLGVVAGLGAAVCFATYFLIGEHGVSQLPPLRVIIWSFGVAAVALNLAAPLSELPAGLVTEQVSLLGRLAQVEAPGGALMAWVVVLGTLAPFFFVLAAMQHIPATAVTTFAMLEPVGAVALGWAWFEESMGVVAVVGCAMVVTGILLAHAARRVPMHEPVAT